MGLKINRKNENRVIRAFTHKLADIPGGVTVSAADLTQSALLEGTPIGMGSNGLYHVVKCAKLTADAANNATAYTVLKGHNLKVGAFVALKEGGKAYAITAIATNASDSTSDDITVGTTLGLAATAGGFLYEAAAESATTTSALKYAPIALVGESYDVDGSNLVVNAWTFGQIKEANIPPIGSVIKAKLTHILFI